MADILVVDDSPTMQNLVRVALETHGHRIHTADNGLEGLEVLDKIDVPLAIVDINMPKLNGLQMVKKVRETPKTKAMRIIFLTTETSEESKAQMRSVGANAWIGKPFDDEVLVQTVDHFLTN